MDKRYVTKTGRMPCFCFPRLLRYMQIPLPYVSGSFWYNERKLFNYKIKTMEEETHAIPTLVAEIEISYRPRVPLSKLPIVTSAEDAYKLFISSWDKGKIEFVVECKVMLLNTQKRVLGICTLTSGSNIATIVDPKLVFAVALKANATEIILAHNHPSGSLEPSKADHALTYNLKTAGDYLELRIIDHMIISNEGFYSFAVEGGTSSFVVER